MSFFEVVSRDPPDLGKDGRDAGELDRTECFVLTKFSSRSSAGLGDAGTVANVALV